MSLSGQTDLLKLYARVIAPAGKVKTTNLFADNEEIMSLRQFEMSVLKALYFVTLDTTNPQNRALHDVLHIYYTLFSLVTQTVRSVAVNNFTQ